MNIVLRHGYVWNFEDLSSNTIALDGAVPGPRIDTEKRRFSFDHHEGCIGLITSATCQQVLDALLLGLDPSNCTVLINDVDGDTVLSLWLLQNHALWGSAAALSQVRPLVAGVAAWDAHGPAHPLANDPWAAHFYAWVMEPTVGDRRSSNSQEALSAVLQECLRRLDTWWEKGLNHTLRLPDPERVPNIGQARQLGFGRCRAGRNSRPRCGS